jgi:hypothetical protein
MSQPLRLSDSELDAVMAAARPLDRDQRDAFLQAVATALKGCGEIGPGTVGRIVAEQQRRFILAPRSICGRQGRASIAEFVCRNFRHTKRPKRLASSRF